MASCELKRRIEPLNLLAFASTRWLICCTLSVACQRLPTWCCLSTLAALAAGVFTKSDSDYGVFVQKLRFSNSSDTVLLLAMRHKRYCHKVVAACRFKYENLKVYAQQRKVVEMFSFSLLFLPQIQNAHLCGEQQATSNKCECLYVFVFMEAFLEAFGCRCVCVCARAVGQVIANAVYQITQFSAGGLFRRHCTVKFFPNNCRINIDLAAVGK